MAWSKWSFWLIAVVGVLIALAYGSLMHFDIWKITRLPFVAISKVKHFLTFSSFSWRLKRLLLLTESPASVIIGQNNTLPFWLLWMAPFLSGGGYCSEALSYINSLASLGYTPNLRVQHHGDLANMEFWRGLPINTKNTMIELFKYDFSLNETVVICHSEPGAWYPPLFETIPCPPTGYDEPLYVIGRTMFETDRISPEHVKRCNRMNEIWIPSEFNRATFVASGVIPSKLVKVVQSVDVEFFNPARKEPLPLPTTCHMFGPKVADDLKHLPKDWFVFLSIFKWEKRKGWDILIRAYVQEFNATENVVLFLQTTAYHTDQIFKNEVLSLLKTIGIEGNEQKLPAVYLSDTHIPQDEFPRLYKAANAFVLPSRGEGWGRPYVEAMSMSLPVIATNWSGMTEYMAEENSYLLPVKQLTEIQEGPFAGHLWAEPLVEDLQSLMRHVYSHPSEAKNKGKVARNVMVTKYSPKVVAGHVLQELLHIEEKIQSLGK